MTNPKSFFDRTPNIRSHGEMEALLEKRAPGVLAKVYGSSREADPTASGSGATGGVTVRLGDPAVLDNPAAAAQPTQDAGTPPVLAERPPAVLTWMPPVRNEDGSGYQCAGGTIYVVRKTMSNDKWCYWAWADKKLLGYSRDVKLAREHCQMHADRQP